MDGDNQSKKEHQHKNRCYNQKTALTFFKNENIDKKRILTWLRMVNTELPARRYKFC